MASCSFPPSFIMLSLCTPPSLPGRELLFLSMQTATHPHVWVTSCVRCSGTLQTPLTPFHTPTRRDQIARYVRTNTSCRSPSDSFLILISLTERSICQLICFFLFLNWFQRECNHSGWKCCSVKITHTTDICTCDLSESRPDFTAQIYKK